MGLFNRPRSVHKLKAGKVGYLQPQDLRLREASAPANPETEEIAEGALHVFLKLAQVKYRPRPESNYLLPVRKIGSQPVFLEVLLPENNSFLPRLSCETVSLEDLANDGFYQVSCQVERARSTKKEKSKAAEKDIFPVGDMKVGTTAYLRSESVAINTYITGNKRYCSILVDFRTGKVSTSPRGEYLIPITRTGNSVDTFVLETAEGANFTLFNDLSYEVRRRYDTVDYKTSKSIQHKTTLEPEASSKNPPQQPKTPSRKKISDSEPKKNIEEILAPLDGIFLPAKVYDEVLLRTNVPDLVAGGKPKYHGVILHGPPGTGKTVLQMAIAEVYRNKGAYAQECHFSLMAEKWVGTLGNNLETAFQQALEEARGRERPSFLYFDESTSLVSKVEGRAGAENYYQEGLDVMKKYIGNYPELLVVSISTNGDLALFDEALIRDGRLKAIEIDYPGEPEKVAMWKYFAKRSELALELNDEQARELAGAIPKEQGAFIADFCQNYIGNKRAEMLKQSLSGAGEKTILAALKAGGKVDEEALRQSLSYDHLLADVSQRIREKWAHDKPAVGFAGK